MQPVKMSLALAKTLYTNYGVRSWNLILSPAWQGQLPQQCGHCTCTHIVWMWGLKRPHCYVYRGWRWPQAQDTGSKVRHPPMIRVRESGVHVCSPGFASTTFCTASACSRGQPEMLRPVNVRRLAATPYIAGSVNFLRRVQTRFSVPSQATKLPRHILPSSSILCHIQTRVSLP